MNTRKYFLFFQGKDSILPAVLEFREDTESAFFNALTVNLDPTIVNFKGCAPIISIVHQIYPLIVLSLDIPANSSNFITIKIQDKFTKK